LAVEQFWVLLKHRCKLTLILSGLGLEVEAGDDKGKKWKTGNFLKNIIKTATT